VVRVDTKPRPSLGPEPPWLPQKTHCTKVKSRLWSLLNRELNPIKILEIQKLSFLLKYSRITILPPLRQLRQYHYLFMKYFWSWAIHFCAKFCTKNIRYKTINILSISYRPPLAKTNFWQKSFCQKFPCIFLKVN
jgi:hypothetical protein